jgi:hypothetical protein
METIDLDIEKSLDFLNYLQKKADTEILIESEKHRLSAFDGHKNKIFEFKCPLLLDLSKFSVETQPIDNQCFIDNYLILLIQPGQAALGYFEEGELENHIVIRRYMTRAKQGKTQIRHLKTKGKSKLGSRIRLQQTIDFFEEINTKLDEWEIIEKTQKIYYSAAIDLWNLVFDSKVECPFLKKDARLQKIPFNIMPPNYEELWRVNDQLRIGKVSFFEPIKLDFFEN